MWTISSRLSDLPLEYFRICFGDAARITRSSRSSTAVRALPSCTTDTLWFVGREELLWWIDPKVPRRAGYETDGNVKSSSPRMKPRTFRHSLLDITVESATAKPMEISTSEP